MTMHTFDVYETSAGGDIVLGSRNTVTAHDERGARDQDELLRGYHAGIVKVLQRKPGQGFDPKHELAPVADMPVYALIIRACHGHGKAAHMAIHELNSRGGWLSDDQKRMANLTPGEYTLATLYGPEEAQAYATEYFWEYERANISANEAVAHIAALGVVTTERELRDARAMDRPAIARHVCGYGVALRPL